MNTVLVNPTVTALAASITTAESAANFRARTRTVSVDAQKLTEKIVADAHGSFVVTGGGVANSYKYRADSAAFALVWATVDGVKKVRVYGERVSAPKSAYGARPPKVMGLTALQFENAAILDLLK